MTARTTSTTRPPSRTRRAVMLPTIILVVAIVTLYLLLIFLGGRVTPGGLGGPAFRFGTPLDSNPTPGLFYVELRVSPKISINTTEVALGISTSTNGAIPAGPPPSGCTSQDPNSTPRPFNVTNCGVPASGWYAVLTYSGGLIASVFNGSSGAPGGFVWTPAGVPIGSGMDLWLVSGTNLTGNGWTLWAAPVFALSETTWIALV